MKRKTLGRKILLAMVALVLAMLVAASLVFALTMRKVSATLVESNQTLRETVEEKAAAYMTEQSQTRLKEIAADKADIADAVFAEFERDVLIVASAAEAIYNSPENYTSRPAALPDAANDGVLTAQVLYSAHTDPSDPAVQEELNLIGNIQDVLVAVNGSQDNMASVYVATESGFTVQADYISAKKIDENGNVMPLEAKERPWYIGAAETGMPYFTPVTRDVHTPQLGIMCGVPVYAEGRLTAVAGAGMYLDNMEGLVHSIKLGSLGNTCIINENGQVLFSTYRSGTMAAVAGGADLRMSSNAAIAEMAEEAVNGRSGVTQLSIDGVANYAAYAPMKTVGWSVMVFLSKEAVESPKNRLVASIGQMMELAYNNTNSLIRNANYILLFLLCLAVVAALLLSVALSRRIVKPIRLLTQEVEAMKGDCLDFKLELNTDDETQVLAESFRSLTERMNEYITDIRTITAERERISTELTLANQIQKAMLPSIFPPFPNRKEFDVFAMMQPAREVGGDFYDFFLIDDDHLCMVMADVSGKGIPAALFMMISKVILQNCAMLGKSAAEILELTNAALCSTNKVEMFVTVWLGILEISTGTITAANAGHEYPALAQGAPFALLKDKHGFIIGGFPGMKYKEYSISLKPGDRLFLYTDGVPEATDSENRMFGTDRMLEALNKDPKARPSEVLRNVKTTVEAFAGGAEQFDDITMLCIEYKGPKKESTE